MGEGPVLLLEGPRSVGKSTLLRQLASQTGGRVLDLDNPGVLDAVATDPDTQITGPGPVFIDEYQRAPIVLDAIKAELNRSPAPGRFVLTGSTRHDSLPPAAQALTGRLARLPIRPLSQHELHQPAQRRQAGPGRLEDLLDDPLAVVAGTGEASATRADYIDLIVAGGFPAALAASSPAARRRWFDSYISLTLERDVREIRRLRQSNSLATLLGVLAARTGSVLNVEAAARAVQLERSTAEGYINLLEKVFLVYRLPAWGRTLTARTAVSPKIHILDSGVAAHLLRLTPTKLAQRDPGALTELGHLIETFTVGELLTQASWSDQVLGTGHWRTRDGDEVDLIIERDDGTITAFEIKASSRVPGDALRPLQKLRDHLGPTFHAGYTLYLGTRAYTYDDRIHVLPLDRIWTP
jgi:hypothetical protein